MPRKGLPVATMTFPAVVVLLLTWGLIVTDGSLLELKRMIKDVTGKNAIPDYSTYGCYCGWGGKGRPVDETDRCCQDHDHCYGRVDGDGCNSKVTLYYYSVRSGKVKCYSDGILSSIILSQRMSCAQETCECDRRFVTCLKKHIRSYQGRFRYHSNFLC